MIQTRFGFDISYSHSLVSGMLCCLRCQVGLRQLVKAAHDSGISFCTCTMALKNNIILCGASHASHHDASADETLESFKQSLQGPQR